MNDECWIEIKRADFLNAIQSLKPTARIKSAPERELQIGLVDDQAVFSTQGASVSISACGNWSGIVCIRLTYFLTFLVAKPSESIVKIIYKDGKLRVSSARFPSKWVDSEEREITELLSQHTNMPKKENILKYKCPKCRRKQGVALDSLESGPFASEEVKRLFEVAESVHHGFGCLSCGNTWADQYV